jgi:formate dehydrogenase subunit beta
MSTIYAMPTQGDPLEAFRSLLRQVWDRAGLDALLAPTNGSTDGLRLLRSARELDGVNPFKPVMTSSAALRLPRELAERPLDIVGVVLRPCELRGLVEAAKHGGFGLGAVVTICVDCLSTLPTDEYRWRASRRPAPGAVTDEALRFAPVGGIVPYRYRSACQQCTAVDADGGDVNVGILGLPVRRAMLLWGRDDATAERMGLDALGTAADDAALLSERHRVLARLAERRGRGRRRAQRALAGDAAQRPEAVAALLSGCGACHACLDACPITAVDPLQRQADGRYSPEAVAHWLVSCADCGMCEEACPNRLPLSTLFGGVRDALTAMTGYRAGRSLAEPVPV